MNRARFMVMTLATSLAIGVVATAVAQDPEREASVLVAPTPPASAPCPMIDIPRLGPDVGDDPTSTAGPVASSLPLPSVMAAPTVGPEPCPSPMPEPRSAGPLGLPRDLAPPMPRIIPANPRSSPPA
jgi:hypothetical protein